MRAELATLALGDEPARWRELGFAIDGKRMWLGGIEVRLGAPGEGVVGWGLRGAGGDIDGLPTVKPRAEELPAAAEPHPNGAIGLDHVVVLTPDFDRTAAALSAEELGLRRVVARPDGARMGFRRLGGAILEVVEAPGGPPGPARFWGLVVIVEDLHALASRLGDRLGAVKPAVQPGRQIASLRASAGLGQPVAFMDPEPA